MNMHSIHSVGPTSMVAPVCNLDVPIGFTDALKLASKFSGRHNKIFPWVQYVYLVDGKLYASDNRCIIEVDLGDPSFGPARFSSGDVAVFRAIDSNPQLAGFNSEGAAFKWEDGQWCYLRSELKGLELVEKSRGFLEKFYRKGRKLSVDTKGAMLDIARRKKSGEAQRFKASVTGLPDDYHWYRDSISKVLAIADRFDTSSIPNSFTFPNGRGLLVQSSQHKIVR